MAVSRWAIKKVKDESGKYLKIEGMEPKGKKANCCPFCDSSTSSGSWTPETCTKCGAVYFFNAWTKDI